MWAMKTKWDVLLCFYLENRFMNKWWSCFYSSSELWLSHRTHTASMGLHSAADLFYCDQVWINMPQPKCIPEGLSIDLTSFSNTPSFLLLQHQASLALPPRFPFDFLCHLSDLALLTLYIMKPARGKRDETETTALVARATGPSFLWHHGNCGF